MKKIIKNNILVLFLLIIGLFIFFYKLSSLPVGVYLDEALHGYNAYSVLLTGKDEYGKFLPLVFRFYGSYNAPLYIYATIIPVKLIGLNAFSVRFVAALSGFLSIFVFWLLLRKLKISEIGSIFFSITPWLVFQSRIGYEVSLAFLLLTIGCLLLWTSIKNIRHIFPAFFFLSLSSYAAYAERFLIAPLILIFIIVFKKQFFSAKNRQTFIYSVLFLAICQIPNFFIFLTPAFFPKADLIGSGIIQYQATKLLGIFPSQIAILLSFFREFFSQYVNYFSPRSLFLAGDINLKEMAPFYSWMIVPFFVGIHWLWKKRNKDVSKFIFILLFIFPIPAALTKDPFSPYRAMPFLLPVFLVISVGIGQIIMVFAKRKFGRILEILPSTVLFLISLIFLWRCYVVIFANERAVFWSYGYEQLANYISNHKDGHFVIDQRLKLSYIELAFFMKFPPEDFQASNDQNIKNHYYQGLPFDSYHRFGNLETRSVNWEKDIYKERVLVGDEITISDTQAKEHFLTKVIEIRSPLNEIIFSRI